jgi:hypothetical protein
VSAARLAALTAAAALAAGCGSSGLPLPVIHSIVPDQMDSAGTAEVTITVDAVLPFNIDYGTSTATVDRSLILNIGPLIVGDSRFSNNGLLTAFVPSKLLPGIYDVGITLVDRRVGTLPRAFTVTGLGGWPDRYTIDPIPSPQHVGASFPVTIRAMLNNMTAASFFNGTVDLQLSKPNGAPAAPTGPFTDGVRTEMVTVFTQETGVIITVTDLLGHMGTSAPAFNVEP